MTAADDSSAARLILQFEGWCQIRQATDPDPSDEPRGGSGYTFAFGDEPDLDRIVRLQPSDDVPVRSHGWPIGVTVTDAVRHAGSETSKIEPLLGATVELLGAPKLENRNWTLTDAGFEPIVPFDLQIHSDTLTIRRRAPLDIDHPTRPLWKHAPAVLSAHAANGMELEPETIGKATGIWDSRQVAVERRAELQKDFEAARRKTPPDDAELAILAGRIAELTIGIDDPSDRRVAARYFVERFGFGMLGESEIVGDERAVLGGTLTRGSDAAAAWGIRFWIGAWDPDVLSAYFVGALDAPYAAS
jgi:hypothetical protein